MKDLATKPDGEAIIRAIAGPGKSLGMTNLDRLVYASKNLLRGPEAEAAAEVRQILDASRRNNEAVGLTGALMFNAGAFAQVVEGPRAGVEATFERIQRDLRHSDVTVLQCGPAESRGFATNPERDPMMLLNDLTGAPPGMTGRSLLLRLFAIGAVVAGVAGGFAYAGGWLSPGLLSPARIVDRFEAVNRPHPGFRRNHAKGLCVAGRFAANGAGARLSKAALFAPGQVTPVQGRVALAGGQPYAADAETTVRSLALLFRQPDGQEWRTGMNNIPVFPVRTPEAFCEQLLAAKPDPATGKPDPARMAAFFAAHPESARAASLIRARMVTGGFADSTFRSLHAFRFVAADGAARPVRWAFVPERAAAAPAGQPDGNALFDAFAAQLRQGPRRWHLVVTLGRVEDPTADATQPWPADRAGVDVGTLTLTEAKPEAPHTCRDINFDPLVLPDGIAPGDDPLLSARSAAYAQSFTRRAGETKAPSAVTGAPNSGAAL